METLFKDPYLIWVLIFGSGALACWILSGFMRRKHAKMIANWKHDLDKIDDEMIEELRHFPEKTVLLVLQSKEGLAEVYDAKYWEIIGFPEEYFLRYHYDARQYRKVIRVPGMKILPEGKAFQVRKTSDPEGIVFLHEVQVMFGG